MKEPGAIRSTAQPSVSQGVMPAPLLQSEGSADAELVAAVLRKDRKATAELVSRHSGVVYGYVRRRLAPRADLVDDLVQEIFLAVLKGLRAYGGHASLRSWILGIARRRVADHYRAALRREEILVGDDEPALGPATAPHVDDAIDRARLQKKTRRMLARLPAAYAYALVWRYWDGRSVRDIAQDTGKTEKSVERMLARARARFKRGWETA